MTLPEFERAEPRGLALPLQALWWAGRGEWEQAHGIAQEIESSDGSWVHAYLHRVEGDVGNAAYWYRRAGKPVAAGDLRLEWEAMVEEMLRRLEAST